MPSSFQEKKALADIFGQVKDGDTNIFGVIVEIFRKEKIEDCIGYLSENGNQTNLEPYSFQQVKNSKKVDNEQQLGNVGNTIKLLKSQQKQQITSIKKVFEEKEESKQSLINNIKCNRKIIEFLQFLVHLTSIDDPLIQCGLDEGWKQSLENIRIKNTSVIRGNFVRCNFSGSEFANVDISGVNLNGAQLFNCKWKNLKIHELNKLDGHSDFINSVCYSPDGNTLASGSDDKSIRLWDVKTGQEVKSTDKNYKDLLAQFKAPLFSTHPLPESNTIHYYNSKNILNTIIPSTRSIHLERRIYQL